MFQIEKLYMQYKQDIYHYLLSLTHNPNLSEDLLSDTFLSVMKSIHSFQGNSTVKTWIFSIARHKWLEYLRKTHHEICFDELATVYLNEDIEENVVQKDIINRIKIILLQEEERTSSIVRMRIAGYSYYEISLKFGISEGSARVIDFRAKRKIKEILLKEGLYHE